MPDIADLNHLPLRCTDMSGDSIADLPSQERSD
jgi:hypothetical protein